MRGAPAIELAGGARVEVSSAKAQALLYYLAVTGRAHTRASLAGLLWGDLTDEAARGNLRKALNDLGLTLTSYLAVSRQTIDWQTGSASWIDVRELMSQVGDARPRTPADVERITQGIDLYQGDFLEGFYVRAAHDFEVRMLAERARLRERMLHGLDILAQWLADQGNLTQAITYTRRLLELEPWREETHRQTQSDPNRSHSVDQHRREGIRKFEPFWRSLLAEALVSAGQFDKALEEVEDTLVFAKETENG